MNPFFGLELHNKDLSTSLAAIALQNIHAQYDISNDLLRMLSDQEKLMYSSAISNAIISHAPEIGRPSGLIFKGIIEDAQRKKLDTLCDRAQLKQGQTLLDIGFGWAGLSVHAAKVSLVAINVFSLKKSH